MNLISELHNKESADSNSSDALENANKQLKAYLKKACLQLPINTEFTRAQKAGLTVMASDDNKLKAYSWDTYMGGTMALYSDAIQYVSASGMQYQCMHCDPTNEGDYGVDYTEIATLKLKTGNTIYFILTRAVLSQRDVAESIDAYVIKGDSLLKAPVFKTTKELLSSIGYDYDQLNTINGKGAIPRIHFSKDKARLYIPIVTGETISQRSLVYVLDVDQFVFDKNAK